MVANLSANVFMFGKSNMTKKYSFPHIKSANDLITPYANTRAAFLEMALEKNIRATPFIVQARDLKIQLQSIKTPEHLLKTIKIQAALLTAAGISAKAAGHIDDVGKKQAIENLIEKFLKPQGESFRDELVYRFLLTSGDSLGGSMRNVVGALAQKKLVQAILARFDNSSQDFFIIDENKHVIKNIDDKNDLYKAKAESIKGICWENNRGKRLLLFNLTVPIVKKNVDMCLLNGWEFSDKSFVAKHDSYICLGELKGGADPAGADEHWKTARSALLRIKNAFLEHRGKIGLFFVGAAIEKAMADEMWEMLCDKQINFAANLTIDAHLVFFVDWLVSQ
jgi:type II restriction enzyme